MLKPGQMNRLRVVELTAEACYLEAVTGVEATTASVWRAAKPARVRLPVSEIPSASADSKAGEGISVGDEIDVFVYLNSDNQWVATTQTPKAMVGDCAHLTVLSVNDHGAFMDWGLPKDLLLPFAEQAYPVVQGNRYVVYVYLDEHSDRVACSTKLHHFLAETCESVASGHSSMGKPPLVAHQQVDLLIAGKTGLGYKAVINGEYLGLIFHQDLGQPLRFGERMKGWIKAIRDDGKIDLSVNSLDAQSRDDLAEHILDHLRQAGGRANFSDKSPPQEIFRVFKVSKKNFKRALSKLYKQRLIRVESNFIELV